MSSTLARGGARRPHTQPQRFRQRASRASGGIGSSRRSPGRTRRRRIVRGAMARVRGWLWWSLPWTVACTWALATDRWWWALGTGLMAALSQAIALRDPGPGLRRRSPDGGRLGRLPRQHGRLDRRARCCPATRSTSSTTATSSTRRCSRRSAAPERSITIEAYIYWRGEIGLRVRARDRRAGPGRRGGEAAARHRRLGHASATRS